MVTRTMFASALLAAGGLLICGCGGQEDSPQGSVPEGNASDAPLDDAVTPEMVEVLAKADTVDGQSDKIVSLCASCGLGMEGSKEYPLAVGEFTMHFCSDHCRSAFSEDVTQSVLAMRVPTKDESNSP